MLAFLVTFYLFLPFLSLGVNLDAQVMHHRSVANLIRKANLLRGIYAFHRFLSVSFRRMLCYSLVLSHSFCDVVYGSCLVAFDRPRIQRILKSCIRFIYRLPCLASKWLEVWRAGDTCICYVLSIRSLCFRGHRI